MSELLRVSCPRCRAEGKDSPVVIFDDYGICDECETLWLRGSKNEMIAVDGDN